jgi:hypothetical protein
MPGRFGLGDAWDTVTGQPNFDELAAQMNASAADAGTPISVQWNAGVLNETTGFSQAPQATRQAIQQAAPQVAAAMDAGKSWGQIAAMGVATWQQLEYAKINMDRARQGLPPLNPSQYGLGVNVGLSTQTILLIGAALFGVVLLSRKH